MGRDSEHLRIRLRMLGGCTVAGAVVTAVVRLRGRPQVEQRVLGRRQPHVLTEAACTPKVTRLKLVTPAVGPASISTRRDYSRVSGVIHLCLPRHVMYDYRPLQLVYLKSNTPRQLSRVGPSSCVRRTYVAAMLRQGQLQRQLRWLERLPSSCVRRTYVAEMLRQVQVQRQLRRLERLRVRAGDVVQEEALREHDLRQEGSGWSSELFVPWHRNREQ